MTDGSNHGIDIGMEYLKGIYTNTNIETREAQPIYILPRDTVRTFLHEKIEEFGLSTRVMGYIGIEITLIASLFTAKFNGFFDENGNIIKGAFITFSVIFASLIIKDGARWLNNRNKLSVDTLAEDLGGRGTIIKPSGKQQQTTTGPS